MLPRTQTQKSANFSILNSLFTLFESPLPRSPSYSGDYSPSYREGYPADYPEGYSGSNSASYPDSCSEDYPEGYPPRYSESYPGSYGESCPEGCSRSCPENCSGDNPESNSGSNRVSYSEDYPDSYPESFDPRPVTEPAQVQRPDRPADRQLSKHHYRIPERNGDNATGHRRPRTYHTRHRQRSPTVACRPSSPPVDSRSWSSLCALSRRERLA
jgi:hypothetical protein